MWARLVALAALLGCTITMGDGFAAKLAAGCHSAQECSALRAEAQTRYSACVSSGTSEPYACDQKARDKFAADAMDSPPVATVPRPVEPSPPATAQPAATASPPATTASAWVPGMGAAPLRTWSVAAAPEAPESGVAIEQRRQRIRDAEYRDAAAQSHADAAPRRAYAKAHCKVVERASQSVWTDTTVDANGLVHVKPVVVYDYIWHCPKGAPAGIEGKDEDSDLADRVAPR